jgi:hypothetical protein
VLVEIGERKLLLTGDAHGDDVVKAWKELSLGTEPAKINVLKMPHHGSIRNTTECFLTFFVADHYVFSANGKYENPDAPTIEAVVKLHGKREITMHFSNADVTWSAAYKLEKADRLFATLTKCSRPCGPPIPGRGAQTCGSPPTNQSS